NPQPRKLAPHTRPPQTRKPLPRLWLQPDRQRQWQVPRMRSDSYQGGNTGSMMVSRQKRSWRLKYVALIATITFALIWLVSIRWTARYCFHFEASADILVQRGPDPVILRFNCW